MWFMRVKLALMKRKLMM